MNQLFNKKWEEGLTRILNVSSRSGHVHYHDWSTLRDQFEETLSSQQEEGWIKISNIFETETSKGVVISAEIYLTATGSGCFTKIINLYSGPVPETIAVTKVELPLNTPFRELTYSGY